ncbi:hypothetical protein R1flu_026308 [Riccia fluitans]|uniref:Uncharacterized protein n=1 Tax=Riccia fluitans TaxID=41844 RepID=A0ABD1XG39_9MARC
MASTCCNSPHGDPSPWKVSPQQRQAGRPLGPQQISEWRDGKTREQEGGGGVDSNSDPRGLDTIVDGGRFGCSLWPPRALRNRGRVPCPSADFSRKVGNEGIRHSILRGHSLPRLGTFLLANTQGKSIGTAE